MAIAATGDIDVWTASRFERAQHELREGRPVILSSGRSAEFVAAGPSLSADCVNTMVSYGRGVLRLAMPASRCRTLGLEPQGVVRPGEAWTAVSVEAKVGVTTGISAADRALTVRVASDAGSTADDLSRPGHVVPIAVHDRGVLARPRSEESAVDLVVAAGFEPAAALCQVLDAGGDIAGPEAVAELVGRGGYPLVEVADVVATLRSEAERPVLENFSVAELPSLQICCGTYDWADNGRWRVALLRHPDGATKPGRTRMVDEAEMTALMRAGREANELVAAALRDGVHVLLSPLSATEEGALEADELVSALEVDSRDWLGRWRRRGG